MEIFRLSKKKYAHQLSGIGASLRGGRWNSVGTEIIYCASSRALAMSEVLVHINLSKLPTDFCMITIDVPDYIKPIVIEEKELEDGWKAFPHLPKFQRYGDIFIRQGVSCLLRVPSVVVDKDWNYLINSAHPDFKHIRIKEINPFKFDERFGKR